MDLKDLFIGTIIRLFLQKSNNQGTNIYELLSASFQGVKRLFVLTYVIAANAANNEAGITENKKYFLPKEKVKNYNVLIDGKNFIINPLIT